MQKLCNYLLLLFNLIIIKCFDSMIKTNLLSPRVDFDYVDHLYKENILISEFQSSELIIAAFV